MTKNLSILLLLFVFQFSFAQVGIGTTTPSTSSALEIKSSNSGLLIPRVALTSTTDTATIPSPATSLLVYNTNTMNDITPGFYYWEGNWKPLKSTTSSSTGSGWNLMGNNVVSTDYLGTNNYFPLTFKVNNNQFSRFHPNGGLAIGNSAVANDNNSVAIGTSANASNSNQASAIGANSTASGFQSTALGYNSTASNNSSVAIGNGSNSSGYLAFGIGINSVSNNNNSFAIGNGARATNEQATALGTESTASGQNTTAIGYKTTATQANSIILGESSNNNVKIGIGTNSPSEKLHIAGSLRIVDGNQGVGKILTSDADGKATWTTATNNSAWNLTGNNAVSTDYLGTNNNIPLIFKVNNNQFARFHPNGGMAFGNGAVANNNNSVAIGTSANASSSNQATAVGANSIASGLQSTALGHNSESSSNSSIAIGNGSNASGSRSMAFGFSSISNNLNAAAIGNSSNASGLNTTALGTESNASGQNATAIGYKAAATQANSIILGEASNNNVKIGIGTNTPDERLHVAGSIKIVDGTQGVGKVLTSDANGKASWATASTSSTGSSGWNLTGNTLSSGSEYLGTNSYHSLIFKVNNTQFTKYHPNGGLAIGHSAVANDNSSVAIGHSANASASNEAVAIGKSATASGYQSMAFGLSSNSSNNSSVAIGNSSRASGQQSTALGIEANASGQNATAIGYKATANQANSLILGDSSDGNARIGIGTNSPSEKLHVAGSVRIVDGTQGLGKVLTSDADGKASWVSASVPRSYADIYYAGSGQTLSQYSNVTFGTTNSSSNITVNNDNIQVLRTGRYKISYRITLTKSTANPLAVTYNLYNGYSNIIPGSLAIGTVDQNKPVTITGSIIRQLTIYDQILVRSNESSSDVSFVTNGCSLTIELLD